MLCASHLHLAMNTKCCVPLTCTLLSLCLAFNIVWMWLLLYLVMGSFPLQGLGLWPIETKKIDLRKTVLCWNCETLQYCLRQWLVACLVPSHYLNQYWLIVNWTLRNKLKWNSNQNTIFFVHDNTFKNVVCKMSAILCRRRWVKGYLAVYIPFLPLKIDNISDVQSLKTDSCHGVNFVITDSTIRCQISHHWQHKRLSN